MATAYADIDPQEDAAIYEPVRRLTADMRKAAQTMGDAEVRYLIDLFYSVQEMRKAGANRLRASTQDNEPNSFVDFMAGQVESLEGVCNSALQVVARRTRTGRWLMGLKGISGVLTAGLLAGLDIRRAPTAASFWRFCFPAGTLIETLDGPVPIESIEADDVVIGADGVPTGVRQTFQRQVSEPLLSIKARGCLAVQATDEHPFLVRSSDGRLDWITAQMLRPGMMLGLPIPQADAEATPLLFPPSHRADGRAPMLRQPLPVDADLAWLLGYFVADGNATLYDDHGYLRGSGAITFGHHKVAERTRITALAQRYFGSARIITHDASVQVMFGRMTVAQTFQALFGHRAENKRIPALLMHHPDVACVQQFLLGYFAGNGHVVKAGRSAGVMMASTVSHTLALQLQRLLLRFGIFAPVHQQARPVEMDINGRTFQQQPWRYCLAVRAGDYQRLLGKKVKDASSTPRRPMCTATHAWTPIMAIEEEDFDGTVYNFETESHTYVAENLAVHNCGLDPSWEWLGKERAGKLYEELREVSGHRRAIDLLPLAARRVNTPEDGLLARVERQTRPRSDRITVRPLDVVRDTLTRTQLVNALATRPWNAQLKTLQWKLTDCLVKVQNRDDAPYYCAIYQSRKQQEWRKNFAGDFRALCPEALKRNLTPLQRPWYAGLYDASLLKAQWDTGLPPSSWDLPEPAEGGTPMLPPGRIELRARRIAAKKLLADLHYCLYDETYGTPPSPNATQQSRGMTHWRVPPGWRETA